MDRVRNAMTLPWAAGRPADGKRAPSAAPTLHRYRECRGGEVDAAALAEARAAIRCACRLLGVPLPELRWALPAGLLDDAIEERLDQVGGWYDGQTRTVWLLATLDEVAGDVAAHECAHHGQALGARVFDEAEAWAFADEVAAEQQAEAAELAAGRAVPKLYPPVTPIGYVSRTP